MLDSRELEQLSDRAHQFIEYGRPIAPDDVRLLLAELGYMRAVLQRNALQLRQRDAAITELSDRLTEAGNRIAVLRGQTTAGEEPQ